MRAAALALPLVLVSGVGEAQARVTVAAPVVQGARSVAPGAAIVVVDVVRNAGRRRSARTRTRFALRRLGVEVALGSRAVPALRRHRRSRRRVALTVPPGIAPGTWRLVACVRGRCRAARLPVRIPAPPPPAPAPLPPPAPPSLPELRVAEPPPPDPVPEPPSDALTRVEDCAPFTPGPGADEDAFTAMFADSRVGWTGGDAAFSTELEGGDTVWLFGDTFLGGLTPAGGRDQPLPDVRNAAVVQGPSCLTTLFRGTLDDPGAFEPDEGDEWHWPNQPVVHGDDVRVFWTRMRQDGDVWAVDGVALATYDERLERTAIDTDVPALAGLWWGAAFADDATHTHVLGIRDAPRAVFLARTPRHDLDGTWEYRTASGWSDDVEDAEPVLQDGSEISTQISVIADGDGWALVSQEALGDEVNLWRSDDLTTWGPRETLTTLPPVDDGRSYNAVLHPQFTDGDDLLISYSVTADTVELSQANADLYRPRFVRAAWVGGP